MAGEDFLPVGIRAVVQDADKFVADLGRMGTAMGSFAKTVRDSGSSIDVMNEAARRAQDQFGFLAFNARLLSDTAGQLNDTLSNVTNHLNTVGNAMAAQRQAAATSRQSTEQLRESYFGVSNALVRFTSFLGNTTASILRTIGGHKALEERTNRLSIAQRNAAREFAQTRREHASLRESTALVRRNFDQLEKELQDTGHALRSAEATFEGVKNGMEGMRNAGHAEIEVQRAFATRLRSSQDRVEGLRQKMAELTFQHALQSRGIEQTRNQLASLAAQEASQQARLQQLSGQLVRAHATLLTFNAGLTLVKTSFKAVGIAATAAVAGIKIFATAVRSVLTVVLQLPKAFVGATNAVKRFNDRIKGVANKMFRIGNSIRFLGTSMTFLISMPIIGFLGKLTQAAIGFEDAFTGVIRTVDDPSLGEAFTLIEEGSTDIRDLTEAGKQLQLRFRQMALDIPLPIEELAKLGEIAGTLGVRGNQNIDTFVRAAAKMGVTTNVSAEVAATALAKVVGIAGNLTDAELAMTGLTEAEIEAMGTSDAFQATVDGLGGVLIALGNKTRAQEDEILNFSQKIAATAKIAGISSASVLAIGSSFASVGVNAARGTTAFQKAIFSMLEAVETGGDKLEIFAAVTGNTTDEFVESFRTDATGAFEDFINGLSANGDKAVSILDAVDLGNERTRQSILSLSGAEGELSRQLGIANEELAAQAEGLSALELEAERRFSTTQNQLQLLKNQFNDLGITIGSIVLPKINTMITYVRGLIESFAQLSPEIKETIITVGLLAAAIGPVITFVGLGIGLFGFLASAVFGAISAFLSLVSALGLLIFPIVAVVGAIGGLAIAFAASIKKIDRFRDTAKRTLVQRMFDFGKTMIVSFAKGMAIALTAVVEVLIALGRIIAYFLQAFSPPRLLPDLDKWGENAMLSYMEGWASADFDIFNDIGNKIEGLLKSMGKNLDDAGKKNLAETILGTRGEIAKAVNQFKKIGKITEGTFQRIFRAMGGVSANVKSYVRALLDVAIATDMVKQAQEDLNRVTKEYEDELRPISDRLREIDRIQQGVADSKRIQELQSILADPRATQQVRELARLEIEEINLKQQTQEIEDQRDIEIQRAEAAIEAAEAQVDAAEETLAAAEALLDVQIKNNNLVAEMKDSVDKLKDAIDSLDVGDISGPLDIEPPDFEGDEDPFDFELDVDLDEIIGDINTAFAELVAELEEIFAPLQQSWGELGDVWAPIFERIADRITEPLKERFGDVGGTLDTLQEKVSTLGDSIVGMFVNMGLMEMPPDLQKVVDDAEKIRGIPSNILSQAGPGAQMYFDDIEARATALTTGILPELGTKLSGPVETTKGIVEEMMLQLFQLGVVKPFGPWQEQWQTLNVEKNQFMADMEKLAAWERGEPVVMSVEELERLRALREEGAPTITFFDRIKESAANLWETIKNSGPVRLLGKLFEWITLTAAPLIGVLKSQWKQMKEKVLPAVKGLWVPLKQLGRQFQELWEVIKESVLFKILVGIFKVGIAVVLNVVTLVGSLIGGIFLGIIRGGTALIEGLIRVFRSIVQIFTGIWQILESIIQFIIALFKGEGFGEAFNTFIEGVKNVFVGLWSGIVEIVTGLWNTLKGLFWGIVDTVIGAFTHLWERLVGGSIIPDMINGIIEWVVNLYNSFIEWVTNLVNDVIGWFTEMYNGVIEWITNFYNDAIQWITDLVNDILEWIGGFVTDFIAFFEDIYNGAIEWITTLITEGPSAIQEFIDGILGKLGELVTSIWDKAVEIGQAVIDGIKSALTGGISGLFEAGKEVVGGLLDGAKSLLGIDSPSKEFEEIGKETINGLVEGLQRAKQALAKMVEATVDTFIEGFSGVFKAIAKIWDKGTKDNIKTTKKWFEALTKLTIAWGQNTAIDGDVSLLGSVFQFTINDLLKPFAEDFIDLYGNLLEAIINATVTWGQALAIDGGDSIFGEVFTAIIDMFDAMVEVFVASLPLFLEMWVELAEEILEAFTGDEVRTAFYNAGANLIDSLAAGMLSRAQALYNTARNIAEGVTDAVNEAYQQSSPSRVFMNVGENVMAGWKMGIESGQAGLLSSMNTAAASLLSAASVQARQPVQASLQSPVQAVAPVSSASVITNAEVNMGGQTINNGIDQVMLQILIEQALRNVL